MRGIGKWLVPLSLIVLVLSVPMVAGAALTPPSLTGYGGSSWFSNINDTDPSPPIPAQQEYNIVAAYQGYDATYYYFLVQMEKINPTKHADSYILHIDGQSFTAAYVTPSPAPAAGDAFVTLTGGGSTGGLEWRLTAANHLIIGPGSTWYVETWAGGIQQDITGNAPVATPIPNAAWLLGSGIIGLIGLQRRRARKAK